MKKVNLFITVALFAIVFTACNSTPTEAEQNAINFNRYVDSVENLTPVYTTNNWKELNDGYEMRVSKTETTMTTLSAEEKAKIEAAKNLDAIKQAAVKQAAEQKREDQAAPLHLTSTAWRNSGPARAAVSAPVRPCA